MRNNRPKVRLGEVLKHYQSYIDSPEPRLYPKLSVRLYGRGVVLDTPTDGATLKMRRHQLAKAGQVILSEIWGKKGAIGFVPPEGEGALCTSHFFLFDVHTDRLDPRWLQAIFDANYLQEQLDAEAKGTTGYAAVRPKILLACGIPLPPLVEQRRIVARIEELTNRIEEALDLRRQAEEEAEALIAAARRSLFGETPGPNWVPLKQFVSEIENGRSPQCESRPASEDEWGVLKVGSVSFGSFDDCENKVLPVGLEFDPRYEVRSGDFLMSRANTTELVGACAIVARTRPRLLLSDKTFRFHFRRDVEVLPQWLDHAMKSPVLRDQIEHGASGTSPTMKNISKEKVLQLLLPQHTIQKQSRIVAELNDLRTKLDALKCVHIDTSVELDALMPSILDRAFRGEL
jgi:type I restriction enzyme S subunit